MSFVYILFIVAFAVAGVSIYVVKKYNIENEKTQKTLFYTIISSVVVAILSFILVLVVPDKSNKDSSSSSSTELTSSEKAASSSKAKDSSNESVAESAAESLKKESRPKFIKKLQEFKGVSHGTITDISEKNGGTIYVTLADQTIDSQTDSELKQYCSTVYHGITNIAASKEQDAPRIQIQDSDGNKIAGMTFLGKYKYYGMGH